VRSRLCLNAIVRNEAAIIERCLDAVAPYVDAWVIGDTGSTDDTPERIERLFAARAIPGELHRFEFVDFEQARNRALDLARATALPFDYLLFVDADMELVVEDAAFRERLSAAAYAVRQVNEIAYFNTRLVRRDVPARYVGATHEYLEVDPPAVRLDGLWFRDHACGANRVDKFERDIRLLTRSLAGEPGNARNVFYLAQSQRDAGHLAAARETYLRRVALGGWAEEAWYARYQVARLDERLGAPLAGVIASYLDAYRMRPARAEPLVELARIHREREDWPQALLYARAALAVPVPDDLLFVDVATYAWRALDELAIAAWYAGAHDEGRRAAERLLAEGRFPASERPRIERNLGYYAGA
jgi:glycosyltransferase involved in cell wall biosynthesis